MTIGKSDTGAPASYSYNVFARITERWPQAGDQLLCAGRDTRLAEDPVERNYRLLCGYKRAGDICVQEALRDPSDRRSLMFPALFNYRHYIELALKALIEEHGAYAGVSLGAKNHKLRELWELFIKIEIAFDNDPLDEATLAVGDCIAELDSVDTNSTAFRYAKNLNGQTPILPRDGLDLVRLHDVMNGIENFFECSDLDFTHKTDRAAEAAEYTREIKGI